MGAHELGVRNVGNTMRDASAQLDHIPIEEQIVMKHAVVVLILTIGIYVEQAQGEGEICQGRQRGKEYHLPIPPGVRILHVMQTGGDNPCALGSFVHHFTCGSVERDEQSLIKFVIYNGLCVLG